MATPLLRIGIAMLGAALHAVHKSRLDQTTDNKTREKKNRTIRQLYAMETSLAILPLKSIELLRYWYHRYVVAFRLTPSSSFGGSTRVVVRFGGRLSWRIA